jgi:hypothetical protein
MIARHKRRAIFYSLNASGRRTRIYIRQVNQLAGHVRILLSARRLQQFLRLGSKSYVCLRPSISSARMAAGGKGVTLELTFQKTLALWLWHALNRVTQSRA